MSSSFLRPDSRWLSRLAGRFLAPLHTRCELDSARSLFQIGLSADVKSGGPYSVPDLVRDHPVDLGRVGLAHQRIGIEVTFALGVLRGKNMALERFSTLHLARRGLLEAFCCAFVRFQFRHIFSRRLKPPRQI